MVPNGKIFLIPGNIPLIADMSSDIFSRNIDYSKFKFIYAGAQKKYWCGGCLLSNNAQKLN